MHTSLADVGDVSSAWRGVSSQGSLHSRTLGYTTRWLQHVAYRYIGVGAPAGKRRPHASFRVCPKFNRNELRACAEESRKGTIGRLALSLRRVFVVGR